MKLRKILIRLAAVSSLALTASNASALLIDTTGANLNSGFPFGASNTATYGQTLNNLAAGDTTLDSFSMFLDGRNSGAGPLDLRGYVAEWDGSKATNILFESATQTMNAAGNLQEFMFSTGGLDLNAGNDYVFFLSISNLAAQAESRFNMPANGDVIDGNFVWMNNATDFGALTTSNWSQGMSCCGGNFDDDMWFKASFSSVPEPTSLALLGLGLIGMGYGKRKRQAA